MTLIAGIKTSKTIEDIKAESASMPKNEGILIPFIVLVEYPKLSRFTVKYLHPDTENGYIFGIKVGMSHVPATVVEKMF